MSVQQLQIEPGAAVETVDGHRLGHVSELMAAQFKVDAPWRRDYWLPTSIVNQVGVGYVVLGVAKDELTPYRMERPAPDEVDVATAHDDGLFSEREMQIQRERMERELREPQSTWPDRP